MAKHEITKADLLMGRDEEFKDEYTDEVSNNLDALVPKLNALQEASGLDLFINSGWRPSAVNASVGGAPHSTHDLGLAADIGDHSGLLRDWILQNLETMVRLGLYMEDFRWTLGWVHVQSRPPRSGKRIYIPYADTVKHPMTAPHAWSGEYDKKFDGPQVILAAK